LALQAELQYNIALCCFKLKQYSQALKHLAEIVDKGAREHPELGIGRCVSFFVAPLRRTVLAPHTSHMRTALMCPALLPCLAGQPRTTASWTAWTCVAWATARCSRRQR
jgi:hypothetical protein